MEKDIRFPIGLFFSILGGVLAIYGLATLNDPLLYQRSLGINLNLWSGLMMIGFGLFMLFGKKKNKS